MATAADPPSGVTLVRADNPGPKTLEGTNSWVLAVDGRAWVVDPGPDLDPHLDALASAVAERGGLAGIALTHRHGDHADGVAGLLRRCGPAPVLSRGGWLPPDAPRGSVAVAVDDGDRHGPFRVLATPGHARDHVVYLHDGLGFVGDTVLGRGSVLLVPHARALAGYLHALGRLRDEDLDRLLPGHGPLVQDPRAKLDEYIAHRLDRERRLVAALADGARSVDALLDAVWDDAPGILRLAAAVTLQAHLDKLADEGRLPADVERQDFGDFDGL
jgi:glyoxylase-like metal-dependent hydrolase (beta-lactamase superfamily II)